jgi:enoyl-CoA hydratase
MTDKVLVERNGPVTTLIINRPKSKNALDNEAAHALADALRAFDADPEAHVAVLTGAGGAFCAGADLKELGSGVDYFPWAGSEHGPLRAPLSKPVIAAIEGHACAGGLGVALFCDIRIVDDTAVFGVFSRRWGVPMSDGTTVRLPRIVGQGRALEIILTGRKVPAEECLAIGLCEYVVRNGEVRAKAEALAHDIARFPPVCVRADRRSAIKSQGLSIRDGLIQEWYNGREALVKDGVAGAARFKTGLGRHGDFGKI